MKKSYFSQLRTIKEKREYVLGVLEEDVNDFFYYNRKHDEELPPNELQAFLEEGWVSVQDFSELAARVARQQHLVEEAKSVDMELEQQQIRQQRRQLIVDALSNTMSKFVYYDRKEDNDLQLGDIQECLKNGTITIEEMVDVVRSSLEEISGEIMRVSPK